MKFDDVFDKFGGVIDSVKDINIKDLKKLKALKDLKDIADLKSILKAEEDKKKEKNNVWLWILAIIGIIAVCVAVGYAIYKFLVPDYLEDYDEDFEDFDDDFFEDDDDLTSWDDDEEIEVNFKNSEPLKTEDSDAKEE